LAWHLDALRREWNDLGIPGFAIDPAWLGDHAQDEDGEHGHGEEDEAPENPFGHVANSGGETESGTLGVSRVFSNGFVGLAVSRLENFYGLPRGVHAHAHEEAEEHGEHDDGHGEDGAHAHGADV